MDAQHLSAKEAAEELGISLATLYAYVSRGLIRSEAAGNSRTRLYRAEDVQALKQRKEQRQDPERAIQGALHWGAPILESGLSLIADGRLYYRGHDAVTLALEEPLERVAMLLWTNASTTLFPHGSPALSDPRWQQVQRELEGLSVFERFQVLLPLAATADPAGLDLRPTAVVACGARIVSLLVAIACGTPAEGLLSSALQRAWAPKHPEASRVLNAALVLCADHELNVSAFTARCAASAASSPYAVVAAGLAAVQGPKHGGHTQRVEALFAEAGSPEGARAALVSRLQRGEEPSGFGHTLYPQGDPRGRALLQLVEKTFPDAAGVKLARAIAHEAQALMGEAPTIDFALVTLAHALELPRGSALALFALGRSVGWIGHALEQYQEDQLIRPRARYVGPPPLS